jgi:penicillin-binding protein 2
LPEEHTDTNKPECQHHHSILKQTSAVNKFANKQPIITGFIVIMFIILLMRLFYIQVIDGYYKRMSDQNVLRYELQYPARGLIYDRHHTLLVGNQMVYDIVVIPREVKDFDTIALSRLLNISVGQIDSIISDIKTKAKKTAAYQPNSFCKQVSVQIYAQLQEQWFKFPGFYAQARSVRSYPRVMAGNLIGYIGEADNDNIANDAFYTQGSNVGKIGIERSYEKALRGRRGVSVSMRDVYNRIIESYRGGALDTPAVAGSTLTCTIDADLQEYGEQLMQNKVGSIVAIEPATGEILALISSPNFDPSIFTDIHRAEERTNTMLDPLNPLFNRAVMAQYPPGSVFKLVNALVAQQEGVAGNNTYYSCHGGYFFGNTKIGCHHHFSPLNLVQSIQVSCNAYYCQVFRSLIENPEYGSTANGLKVWRNHVASFGIGDKLGSDVPNELPGTLPDVQTYDGKYGEGRWKSLTILSLSIGQGELGVTPLHMANLAAIIANKGTYYTPHLVKQMDGNEFPEQFRIPRKTSINAKYFEPMIEGMSLAVKAAGGTAWVAQIPEIEVCGKTGTAQNPHGDDHSVFICFAPRNQPKIAIAVYVENGTFGATWAAPIASLMIEKYLKREISRPWLEERIFNSNLLPQNAALKK